MYNETLLKEAFPDVGTRFETEEERAERIKQELQTDEDYMSDFDNAVREENKQAREAGNLAEQTFRVNISDLANPLYNNGINLTDALTNPDLIEGFDPEAGADPETGMTPLGGEVSTITGRPADEDNSEVAWYFAQTAWRSSLAGMLLNEELPEYDPEMEARLGTGGQVMRDMLSFGPDLPFLMIGAGVPAAGTKFLNMAAKVVPWAQKAIPKLGKFGYASWQGSAGMGFYSGARQLYYDTVAEGNISNLEDWKSRTANAMWGTMKGQAIGAVGGAGHFLRMGKQPLTQGTMFAAESAVISAMEVNMDDPFTIPRWEDFAIGFSHDVGINLALLPFSRKPKPKPSQQVFEAKMQQDYGMPSSEWLSPKESKEHGWYWAKYENAFVGYGVNPHKLAFDSQNDISVMESLSDPTRYNIRSYDISAGNTTMRLVGEDVTQAAVDFLDAIQPVGPQAPRMQREQDEVAGMADIQQTGTTQAGQLAIPPNAFNPLNLGQADDFQVITYGGRELVLPTNREQSIAMTGMGRMSNPVLVKAIVDMTEGMFPTLAKGYPGEPGSKVSGWFARAEIGRLRRLTVLQKRIKQTERRIAREQREGFQPVASVRLLDGLRDDLRGLLNKPELLPEEMEIAINNEMILGEGAFAGEGARNAAEAQGKVLLTLTHEFGHMLDYVSANWERGQSEIDNPLMSKLISGGHAMQGFNQHVSGLQGVIFQNIQDEAMALSLLWRPVDAEAVKGSSYRMSSAEIMADVNSVILNNPDIARQIAPTLMKTWDDYLNNRPNDADDIRDMLSYIEDGTALQKVAETMAGDELGFGRADAAKQKDDTARRLAANGELGQAINWITNNFWDSTSAARKYINGNKSLENQLERYQFVDTVQHHYMGEIRNRVLKPMEDAGITNQELGLLLFHNRVMTDVTRRRLVNAFGFNPETSNAEFQRMYDDFKNRADIDVDELLNEFYAIRQETVVKMAEESGLFSDRMLNTMRDNKAYARLELVRYYEQKLNDLGEDADRIVGANMGNILTTAQAAARVQKGSFDPIVNPFAATLENDLLMIKTIQKQVAIRELVLTMQSQGGPVVSGAEWNAHTRQSEMNPKFDEDFKNVLDQIGVKRGDMSAVQFAHRVEVTTRDADGDPVLDANGDPVKEFITKPAVFYVPKSVMEVFRGTPELIQKFYAFSGMPIADAKRSHGIPGAALVGAAKTARHTNDFFRFWAIVANIGFQTANVSYDAGRTYLNAPPIEGKYVSSRLPLINMIPHYREGFKSQWANRVKKSKYDGVWEEMMLRGLVTAGRRYADDVDGMDVTDRLVGEFYNTTAKRDATIAQPWQYAKKRGSQVAGALEGLLNFAEGVQNEAGYRYLKTNQDRLVTTRGDKKRVGLTDDEVEHISRTQLGAPAYRRRGKLSSGGNLLFPFLNTAKEGIRGDWEAWGNNWEATAAKLFTATVLPTIVQTLMEVGVFDNEEAAEVQGGTWSQIMATQSEYTKSSGIVVPLYLNRRGGEYKGGVFRLPFPQNPMQRALAGVVRESILSMSKAAEDGDMDAAAVIWDLAKIGSTSLLNVTGDLPGLGPAVRMPYGAMQIAKGENPMSQFKGGGDYFTNPEMKAMNASDGSIAAWERTKGVLRYTADSLAIPAFSKFMKDNSDEIGFLDSLEMLRNPPEDADVPWYINRLSEVTHFPLGYGMSGYYKYGNGGINEKLYQLRDAEAKESATRSIKAKEAAEQMMDTGTTSGVDFTDDPAKDATALQRHLKAQALDQVDNDLFKWLQQSSTQSEKQYIFKLMQGVDQ